MAVAMVLALIPVFFGVSHNIISTISILASVFAIIVVTYGSFRENRKQKQEPKEPDAEITNNNVPLLNTIDLKFYPLYLTIVKEGEELGIMKDGTIDLNGQKTTDAQAVFDYLVMFAKEYSKK